jgi:predicted chitinase
MKLLAVITEDPVEKLDILKQFAKDAPVTPKKSVPSTTKPAQASAPKVTAKSVPVKKAVALEPSGLGAHIEQAAKSDGITGAHLANFMAQCKVETAGFKSLTEWSSGQQYEGRKDLGNVQPGDGMKFKGRGFLHLTGRENYTRCNKDCGWANTKLDIVRNPDLVATNVQIAITSALWYWNLFIRPNYKATSIVAVSTRVNGTNPNGLNARINAFKDYCAKLGIRIQNIVAPIRKATKHAEIEPAGDIQVAANDTDDTVIQTDLAENQTEQFCADCGGSLSEEGKASRALCTSGRPDSALGASQLASCKSQGLRARDGEKSHLITHGARKVRVTVGGKKIKGKRYGGPLPDYGTRKNQLSEADAPKVYAIGDSHAEGLSYAKGIINYAHGGQASTSNTNYSGNYNGHPTGIDNVPEGSFVVISQGCNDAANSSRAYQDSKGRTPLVPPETIANHVVRLVNAAEAKRCKVVFVLFPNGDAKIKPYYGGPYQEKVREAIRSAVGVPIIDLEGSTLSDGVHAVPSAYKTAGSKVLSIFKIINEALSVPWSGRDPAFNDIQKALISIGYKDVTVTGMLDKPTQLALIDFQKNSGLQVTGSANVETLKQLDRISALTTPTPAKTDTAKTDTASTAPKPVDQPKTKPAAPTKPSTTAPDPNIRPRIRNDMSSYQGRNQIMKYLLEKGADMTHVQGIMTNMEAESKYDSGAYVAHDIATPAGLKPGTPEYAAWKTSPAYLKAGPSGGLCQWHDSKNKKRFTNMMNSCGGEGSWQTNWQGQLEFLLSEAETKPYLKKKFASAEEASKWFTEYWERPNHAKQEAENRLVTIGKRFVDKLTNNR